MVMRIGGLASGMDIDSIIEKLMQAEKAPLNKLHQTKQKYEWQRDAYRDVNKQLKAFDDFLFPGMTLEKNVNKKTVTSSNAAISATPTTAANGQSLAIESVTQLAKSGNSVGQFAAGTAGSQNLGLTADTEVEMQVLQNDGTMKNVKVQFTTADTIDSAVSKLKKDTGLNAFYDSASGQLAISTQATGRSTESFTVSNTANPAGTPGTYTGASLFVSKGSEVFEKLGFANTSAVIANGENAEFKVNGATISRQSNTFQLDGFNITLNDTYTGNQPITLTSKTDVNNMVDQIKKFVETYNGIVTSFSGMLKEPKYRDYTPLTDEQKKDMDEKEIEAWEKKAKSGVLRGDGLISGVLSSMRTTMYSSGGGKQDNRATGDSFINTLYEMGITTSKKMSDNGKLEINEEKLRAAIEKDPDQVFKTFSDPMNDNGIVQKLRKNIGNTVKLIEKKAGKEADSTNNSFQIGLQINNADDRIDTWKYKLERIEARYWKQFTAMETAINKANTQSSSLFSSQQQM